MMRRTVLLLLLLATPLFRAFPARAAQYETFVDVDGEDGLYNLLEENQISQSSFDTLVELMRQGVDLNTASRDTLYQLPNLTYADVDAIIAYRKDVGRISDPAALVSAGVLPERKVAAIAAFLVVGKPSEAGPAAFPTSGDVRYNTVYTAGDARVPSMALQARVKTMFHLTAGVATVLTRNRIGAVTFDPTRSRLESTLPVTQLNLRKYYVQWDTDDYGAILGTYRIGFGQRLTFDTTNDVTPNGFTLDDTIYRNTSSVTGCRESAGDLSASPCAGDLRYHYVGPDYRWTDRLRGVAAGFRNLSLGPGKLQGYGFLSYQPGSIYQYEIYDKTQCTDPQNNQDPACAAPPVYVQGTDPLAPQARFSYETLPDVYEEALGGANLSYSFGSRAHVGVTGYGSTVSWQVPGAALDFQEWAPIPYGGPFGAVGADAAWGRDWADVFLEVTRSFDSMPGGGGDMGAILRATGSWKKNEVEASLRYYGPKFANPHARPISAADENDGLRARDETGLRLRYTGAPVKELNLRGQADFWAAPSTGVANMLVYARADYDLSDLFGVGLWSLYEDKDLSKSGRTQCFETSNQTDPNGQTIPCAGMKFQNILRLKVTPTKQWAVTLQFEHQLLDDVHYNDRFRNDVSGWLIASYRPIDQLRLSLRSRYLYQDVTDNTYLEQSLWTYLEADWRITKQYRVRLRYDLIVYLDQRSSTLARSPSPENWVWLTAEAKF